LLLVVHSGIFLILYTHIPVIYLLKVLIHII